MKSALGSIKRPSGSRPPVPFAWRLSDAPPFASLSATLHFLSPHHYSLSLFCSVRDIRDERDTLIKTPTLPGYRAPASRRSSFFSSPPFLSHLPRCVHLRKVNIGRTEKLIIVSRADVSRAAGWVKKMWLKVSFAIKIRSPRNATPGGWGEGVYS